MGKVPAMQSCNIMLKHNICRCMVHLDGESAVLKPLLSPKSAV